MSIENGKKLTQPLGNLHETIFLLWMPEAADAVWPDFQRQESSVSEPSCKHRVSQSSMR